MPPLSQVFVNATETFTANAGIEVVHFRKHQSKDEKTQGQLQAVHWLVEAVLYFGIAKEKYADFRVIKQNNPPDGGPAFPG